MSCVVWIKRTRHTDLRFAQWSEKRRITGSTSLQIILKVLKKVTHVVIEVKQSIGTVVTAAMKNEMAQLFLEAIYCYEMEKRGKKYCNEIASSPSRPLDQTIW